MTFKQNDKLDKANLVEGATSYVSDMYPSEKPEILPITPEDTAALEKLYRSSATGTNIASIVLPLIILILPVWNTYLIWSASNGVPLDDDTLWFFKFGIFIAVIGFLIMKLINRRFQGVLKANAKEIYHGELIYRTLTLEKPGWVPKKTGGAIRLGGKIIVPGVYGTAIEDNVQFGDKVILEIAVNQHRKNIVGLSPANILRVRLDK